MRIAIFLLLIGQTYTATAGNEMANPSSVDLSAHVMEKCDDFSQAGMRACLRREVNASAKALIDMEEKATTALKHWDEKSEFVARAESQLRSSRKAFIAYRDAQCIFAASLGGGAIPKALEMRQLACLYAINTERLQHLKRLILSIPNE